MADIELLFPVTKPLVPAAVTVAPALVEASTAKLPMLTFPLVELPALMVTVEPAVRSVFREVDVPFAKVTPVEPLMAAVVPDE